VRRINSYADVIGDLQDLIEAVNRHPELLPALEPELEALTEALAEIQGHKARQNELTALRQAATQLLQAGLARGREVAIQVRSLARGKIGPRNEVLVHFKVTPIRKRKSKPPATTPEPTEPEEPEEPSDGGPVEAAKATAKPAPSDKTVV
jgi:hypothetical protein